MSDPTPREILTRAIERLPPHERGRARDALRELTDQADEADRLRERLDEAAAWLTAARRRIRELVDLRDWWAKEARTWRTKSRIWRKLWREAVG